MPARFVIHAVGPVWHGGNAGEAELLRGAYRAALREAELSGVRSIAFPAISTGIYGYPLREATRIAVASCEAHASGSVVEVIFACFDEEVLAAYRDCGVELSSAPAARRARR